MENVKAGVVRKPGATIPSNDFKDRPGEDNIMAPVVSDIIHTRHSISPKAPLSHQPKQQNPISERKAQGPPTNTPINPLRPSTQIAVHIRSISSSPSHIRREKPTSERGPGLQPGSEARAMTKGPPTVLPSTQNEREGQNPQPRKRGRPKGWKPGKPYTDGKDGKEGSREKTDSVEPKKSQPTKELKRRGRPPRPLEPSVRDRYLRSNAEYTPFTCEWNYPSKHTCPAELQNMKTLRKHVFIVHGDDEEAAVCRWGKCAGKKNPVEFAGQAEFEEHMEEEHFRSFMWYRGEGYQNDGTSALQRDAPDGLPSYLFDKDGNQVTPSVTDQQFEDDQHYKERKRKLRRLLILKDENAPSEEEYTKQTLGIP